MSWSLNLVCHQLKLQFLSLLEPELDEYELLKRQYEGKSYNVSLLIFTELTLQAQAQAAQLAIEDIDEDDEEVRLALEYSQLKAQYDSTRVLVYYLISVSARTCRRGTP